ncbi:unnamed protein product [Linum trigynum]|uniref:Reverse transcriptase domain-containing protein n=1 Tax=Linum trigynum TaxID=586398 RepID=A0AAV2FFQ0_9ROSI
MLETEVERSVDQAGGKNTGYFHKVANYRRRVNYIGRIRINGQFLENKDAIAMGIVGYYQGQFRESIQHRPFPKYLSTSDLGERERYMLDKPFSEQEIWLGLRDNDGSKATGPDGFTIEFLKKCWQWLKGDVLKAFQDFYESGFLPNWVTHSFVCLAPKKDTIEDIKDLRPINLIGSINKLISKVLSRRLSLVLPNLISQQQQASVKGRQISEAGLIANELVDSRRKSRKPGLMFKIDIEKAFDNVNWECLFKILTVLGFSDKWKKWVKGTMCSLIISVLVIGEAKGFFKASKGLRQGDPLSPGLFVMMMEVLSWMLNSAREAGKFEGFYIK